MGQGIRVRLRLKMLRLMTGRARSRVLFSRLAFRASALSTLALLPHHATPV